ncbi:DUF3159 domain-containing protein [Pseudolysinimonas yzui]|uniref:DUF3159 domain-containing protein n=1 Tax=Pseudolysinimonas yzui TaxID=2708254 RepID=A0A8J3GNX0_9MICO|nr:DUF3159 domain-containing protein [Pseudolysinimonas yzui]GHF08413.1 hypothetical protein GCM10011600_06570 [Pseudolysinimonas yzui]
MAEQQPADDAVPTFREAMSAAARRSGLGKVTPGETPTAGALLAAIGGVRGLVESILPGLGFLVTYTITQNLVPSVLAPLGLALVFIVVRVVTRQPVTTAIAGALGIGISAALALFTGNANDNFVPGFFINGGVVLVMAVSLIARRPFVGVLVGLLLGDDDWRRNAAKLRVATVATILWATLSAVRLAVQVPLYLAESTEALAATKLVMGVPLYAALLWVTWLLVRTAWRTREEPADGR